MSKEDEVQTLLAFLDEAIEVAKKLVPRLAHGSVTDVEVATLCMHLRTVELAGSVGVLVRADSLAGVPLVYRGLLEAFVDLLNILEFGEEYLDDWMSPKRLDAEIRFVERVHRFDPPLEEVLEGPGPELVMEHFERRLSRVNERLREKIGRKKWRPGVKDRFAKAGMLDLHESVYGDASDYSHNNLLAMREQHVLRCEDGSIRLQLDGPDRHGVRKHFLSYTSEHLYDSTVKTHEHFQTDCEDVLHHLRVKYRMMLMDLLRPNQ